MRFLDEFNLEPGALGRSDYPAEFPLREVLVIARHCAGGIILGFEQFHATAEHGSEVLERPKGKKDSAKENQSRRQLRGITWKRESYLV